MEIKQHKNPSIDIKSSTNIKFIVFILFVVDYVQVYLGCLICLVVHLIHVLTQTGNYRKLIT